MTSHVFRTAQTCAVLTAMTLLAAQSASALPPRTAPSHPVEPPGKPGPDLMFKSAWVQVSELPGRPPVHTAHVRAGHALAACFVVTNAGGAQSGPYQVAGGNFGTPTIPSREETGLAPGASHQDCLGYDAPFRAGPYKIDLVLTYQHKAVAKTAISITVYRLAGGGWH